MLKKTGIVVATAALSMLAVSPLAFAGDKGGDHHNGGKDDKSHSKVEHKDDDKKDDGDKKDHEDKKSDHDEKKHGDGKKTETKKVEEGNLSNDCEFGNQSGDAEQSQFGGSSLLGVVGVVTGAVTNAATQTNTLNCANVNVTDVIDFNANNESSAEEQAFIERSFNDED